MVVKMNVLLDHLFSSLHQHFSPTLMTDGASAFGTAALFSTTGQMDVEFRKMYLERYNRLLHGEMDKDKIDVAESPASSEFC